MTIAIKPESIRDYRSTADGPRTDRAAHRCRAMRFHCADKQATRRPCALMQAPWQGKLDLIEGVILHESMPEHAMAAE
jgi:hypothetical protein